MKDHNIKNRKLYAFSGIVALLLSLALRASAADKPDDPETQKFQSLAIRLESFVTDNDAEAVVVVDAGVGLRNLKVTAPNGKQILSFSAKTAQNLGVTKIQLETPEPTLDQVKVAYPAGVYKFHGETVAKDKVIGEATLSHSLLEAPVITTPVGGATNVQINNLMAVWKPVAGTSGYFLELERGELGPTLKVDLPATATSFTFPPGYLLLNSDYVLGVASIGADGNRVFYEIRFHTQ